MNVFVAGATGAVGRQLVPLLIDDGHDVAALVRTEEKADAVRALGATPVIGDALNPESVAAAVATTEPDAIIHQLTALTGDLSLRNFDRDFALTNRLRTEAIDHLLSAGRAAGVRRVLAQSFAGWPYARTGAMIKDEDAELDPDPVPSMRQSHAAIAHLERAVTGFDGGLVLRYGLLYGPGTSLTRGGVQVEMLRARKFPVIGGGGGIGTFTHVRDAARAAVQALGVDATGVLNIVDDDPAPAREWLPEAARIIGAKTPLRVPRWVGRLAAGPGLTMMMTEARGASNARAKAVISFSPEFPSWRSGFAAELT